MKSPMPTNLSTPAEIRAAGWAAEERDADGHLISSHGAFDSDAVLVDYVREVMRH